MLPVLVVTVAPRRFRSLSVTEEVYNKLREIASRRGFATLSDTVAYLVSLEELVLERLERLATTTSGNVTTSAGNVTTSRGNVTNSSGSVESRGGKRRATIREVLARERVQFLSAIQPRNPEAFVAKARREGAVVLEGDDDTAIVDPGFYSEFVEKLAGLGEADPGKALQKLGDEAEKRLFEFMYRNGIIYYQGGGWAVVE